jgi:ribose-phosphate pyrophosphokinase
VEVHTFPDGECRVRVEAPLAGEDVVMVCTLDRPDPKLLPLLFAVQAARDRGARRVRLVAPYLCYMRQDRAFHPGEAVSAQIVARLLDREIDGLVTVDPHLHRIPRLDTLYDIPTRVVRAAPLVAAWIRAHVHDPVIVGPDEESAQWAEEVARGAGAPSTVLRKVRRDDRDVEVSIPELDQWPGRTPVLVDDIVSTAHTLAAAAAHLLAVGAPAPVCVIVHALFAPGADTVLHASGVARVVSCNTVPHATNALDVTGAVAQALTDW